MDVAKVSIYSDIDLIMGIFWDQTQGGQSLPNQFQQKIMLRYKQTSEKYGIIISVLSTLNPWNSPKTQKFDSSCAKTTGSSSIDLGPRINHCFY